MVPFETELSHLTHILTRRQNLDNNPCIWSQSSFNSRKMTIKDAHDTEIDL